MQVTLKAARINANLTQEQAASRFNVSKYTVGNWENGKSFPDANQIKLIEEVYGVGYNDIIFLPQNYT
jgi:transcriptional regulator with XRE-family HTH domain